MENEGMIVCIRDGDSLISATGGLDPIIMIAS